MTATRFAFVIAGALCCAAAPVQAQESWSWNGTVPQGRAIEIKGINGGIKAVAASGGDVRVVVRKHGRRSDPSAVRMEVVQHGGGVTICAVYPAPRNRDENECRPGSGGRMNVQNNDVQVEFEVQVPRGVNFIGRTVNGAVDGANLPADAQAITVNGRINLEAAGRVRGQTVNGSIVAAFRRADWQGDAEFETVNGSITITLPPDVNATVSASTVNGGIETDFPLEVRGRFGPKRVTGTIGGGGRQLSLGTVNGAIRIRRS